MGPHPAVAAVRLAVRQALTGQPRTRPVIVACSGGADSVALASAVAFEVVRHARPAGFVTIDHGLQPGSAELTGRVAALGYELGFDPVEAISVEVGTDGGPEAAARSARYAALAAAARGMFSGEAALILLGHTADDQAETVLLGLGRGSGITSLAGMRLANGQFLRPLLGLRRADTRAACDALGLPVWDDPHNLDPRYRRVRVRREVLPLLDDVLSGGVVEALGRTAAQLQDAEEALLQWACDVLGRAGTDGGGLDVDTIRRCPRAVRTRVLKMWAGGHGVQAMSSAHISGLDELVIRWRGQGPLDLPGGFRVIRRSGTLSVIPPVTDVSAPVQPNELE